MNTNFGYSSDKQLLNDDNKSYLKVLLSSDIKSNIDFILTKLDEYSDRDTIDTMMILLLFKNPRTGELYNNVTLSDEFIKDIDIDDIKPRQINKIYFDTEPFDVGINLDSQDTEYKTKEIILHSSTSRCFNREIIAKIY